MQRILSLALTFAFLAASAALAAPPVVADIPFEFTVGKQVLPAGQYTVYRDMEISTGLAIRIAGSQKGANAFRLVTPLYTVKTSEQPRLVFHRYGTRHFLAQVWGVASGSELLKSAAEKEAMIAHAKPAVTVVVARHNTPTSAINPR